MEKEECKFESDGEKHSCIYSCNGVVENCKKCHRDICSNFNCPLGKGKKFTTKGRGGELNRNI